MKNDIEYIETIQVALPLPVKKLFDYGVPPDTLPADTAGKRALVPFGKRVLTGYITGSGKTKSTERLKQVIEILDDEPAFGPKMLEFTGWLSEYYFCSWGEALKAAIPSGMSPKSVVRVLISPEVSENTIHTLESRSPKSAEILRILSRSADFVTVAYLETVLKTGSISAQLASLQKKGYITIEKSISSETKKLIMKAAKIPEEIISNEKRLNEILNELDSTNVKASVIFSSIYLSMQKSGRPCFVASLLRDTGLKRHNLNVLTKKNYIELYDAEADRSLIEDSSESLISRDESKLVMNGEQEKAFKSISAALQESVYKAFLLHGITGSGKTFVYINAISKALSLGKSVIILVPEISLTPQLIERFRNAFGDNIAVIHSRMSHGERYDSWQAAREGKVKIVLGARSAIFAPVNDLGLIIVDEEHEPSYKQDSPAPRYHARDAAAALARIHDAAVVFGSATPSVESMYNAESGKYTLLKLEKRADNATLPEIIITDLKEARKNKTMSGLFSNELLISISEKANKGEGVLIFRNRRGFSSFLECPDCGFVPECVHCSVSLTYHKTKNHLRCHYCGYTKDIPKICPECGGTEFALPGAGTQKIEEELRLELSKRGHEPSIYRMDLDTTRGKDSHSKILQRFANGEIDILVGTQMIAKGLDFDRVTLVGVVDPDQQMFLPDFRASERAFQLLTQVAGRAGRNSEKPGKVIIQTSHPESDVIKYAKQNSYYEFYAKELEYRLNAEYPPFTRIAAIEFSGKDKTKVDALANDFRKSIPSQKQYYEILGPVEPTVNKLRDYFRKLIVFKNFKKSDPNGRKLRAAIEEAMAGTLKYQNSNNLRITIDIDAYYNL